MIHKSSNEGIICMECSEPACKEAGHMPLCKYHFEVYKNRRKAMEKMAEEATDIYYRPGLRAVTESGDIHNGAEPVLKP